MDYSLHRSDVVFRQAEVGGKGDNSLWWQILAPKGTWLRRGEGIA
jgi:hypothetical protein